METMKNVRVGDQIIYDDGRSGHQQVPAEVLSVDTNGMTVQFTDRADTTRISFSDRGWMDYLSLQR